MNSIDARCRVCFNIIKQGKDGIWRLDCDCSLAPDYMQVTLEEVLKESA